jgi:hypothetical protein
MPGDQLFNLLKQIVEAAQWIKNSGPRFASQLQKLFLGTLTLVFLCNFGRGNDALAQCLGLVHQVFVGCDVRGDLRRDISLSVFVVRRKTLPVGLK